MAEPWENVERTVELKKEIQTFKERKGKPRVFAGLNDDV